MRDDVAARLARERYERFRDRLDYTIVDRLRLEGIELAQRHCVFHEYEPTAAGEACNALRDKRLEAIDRAIDWLTNDPRGRQWEPPAPRAPVPPKKPRFSF